MSMSLVDASPEDKALLFGDAFAGIEMIDFEMLGTVMKVRVILDNREVVLIGDPEKALETWLSGTSEGQA